MQDYFENPNEIAESNQEYREKVFQNLVDSIVYTWRKTEEELIFNGRFYVFGNNGSGPSFQKTRDPLEILNGSLDFELSPEESMLLWSRQGWQKLLKEKLSLRGFLVSGITRETISVSQEQLHLKRFQIPEKTRQRIQRQIKHQNQFHWK